MQRCALFHCEHNFSCAVHVCKRSAGIPLILGEWKMTARETLLDAYYEESKDEMYASLINTLSSASRPPVCLLCYFPSPPFPPRSLPPLFPSSSAHAPCLPKPHPRTVPSRSEWTRSCSGQCLLRNGHLELGTGVQVQSTHAQPLQAVLFQGHCVCGEM